MKCFIFLLFWILQANLEVRPKHLDVSSKINIYEIMIQSVDVKIPVNVSLKSGDIVNCSIPEIKSGIFYDLNKIKNAKFLVVSLKHSFSNTGDHITALSLLKVSDDYSKINSVPKAYKENKIFIPYSEKYQCSTLRRLSRNEIDLLLKNFGTNSVQNK
tara:strand:+ start:1240 stop:1713 length:474 start_codon:yes stop_codon:yes gene_type:complete